MIIANNFKLEDAQIGKEVRRVIDGVLTSGWYVLGQEVTSFEKAFSQFVSVPHVVGVASGTDAITLALVAAGVSPGDEVITTALTAFPTITAIGRMGAIPVIVDVDERTGLIDLEKIELAITSKTRAIVPVHLYGQVCDMPSLMNLANSHHLKVVEDCAQAVGAYYNGVHAGGWGHAAAYSFYPTKNLGAYGDGGAVATSDPELADRLKRLRDYGQDQKFSHIELGFNSRLDELQAAILTLKLQFLSDWIERRYQIASAYDLGLKGVLHLHEAEKDGHGFHLYVVKVPDRDRVLGVMHDRGVQCQIHYPTPVDQQLAYQSFVGSNKVTCDVAKQLCGSIMSLPIHPFLRDDEVSVVIQHLNEVISDEK
jgi:dTDP-4-amino-4,6-dideoxygalactose transaminase